MTDESNAGNDRAGLLSSIAGQVVTFLRNDTGIDVFAPDEVSAASLSDAFVRLDAAIGQLNDLASVYSTAAVADVEPLVLPVAVLAGEYLRVGAGGILLEPEHEPDSTVWILMPGKSATDLTAAVRINLMTGQPDLAAVLRRLMGEEALQDSQ